MFVVLLKFMGDRTVFTVLSFYPQETPPDSLCPGEGGDECANTFPASTHEMC